MDGFVKAWALTETAAGRRASSRLRSEAPVIESGMTAR